jgi:hypothetical protein
MKAYLANRPMWMWALLALPVAIIATPVVSAVASEVIRAVLPNVVQTVLHLI